MRVVVAVVDGDASKLAIVEASNPIVIERFALVRSSLDSDSEIEILKNFGLCCPLLPSNSRDPSQKVDFGDFPNVLPPMSLAGKVRRKPFKLLEYYSKIRKFK